jgi:hypothetical protein
VSRAKVRRKVSWTAQTIGIVSPVAVQGFIGGPVELMACPWHSMSGSCRQFRVARYWRTASRHRFFTTKSRGSRLTTQGGLHASILRPWTRHLPGLPL